MYASQSFSWIHVAAKPCSDLKFNVLYVDYPYWGEVYCVHVHLTLLTPTLCSQVGMYHLTKLILQNILHRITEDIEWLLVNTSFSISVIWDLYYLMCMYFIIKTFFWQVYFMNFNLLRWFSWTFIALEQNSSILISIITYFTIFHLT